MTEATSAQTFPPPSLAAGPRRAGRPVHRRGGGGHRGQRSRTAPRPGDAVRLGRSPCWPRPGSTPGGHAATDTPRRRPIPAPAAPVTAGRRGPRGRTARRRRCGGCGPRCGTSPAAWPPCARHSPRSGWTSSACRPTRWPTARSTSSCCARPPRWSSAELTRTVAGAGGAQHLAGAGRRPRPGRRADPDAGPGHPHGPGCGRTPPGSAPVARPLHHPLGARAVAARPAARRAACPPKACWRTRDDGCATPPGGRSPSNGRNCRSPHRVRPGPRTGRPGRQARSSGCRRGATC